MLVVAVVYLLYCIVLYCIVTSINREFAYYYTYALHYNTLNNLLVLVFRQHAKQPISISY